jgi:hypothetical protein
MESPNSCIFIELKMDEMPLTLGVDSLVFRSLVMEVNPFQVIFQFEWSPSRHTLQ